MKPKVLSAILFSLILMNLLTVSHGKICTKEILHTFKRGIKIEKYKKTIKICCDGFQDVGPKRDIVHSKVLPKCEPICDVGHHLSPSGTCVTTQVSTTTTPRTTTLTTTTTTTTQSSTLANYSSTDSSTTAQPLELFTTTAEIVTTDPSSVIDSTSSASKIYSKGNYVQEKALVPYKDHKEEAYRYPRPQFDPWFASQKQINCSKENICICPLGYIPSADNRNCQPVCKQSCRNGECTAPNRCECPKGYMYNLEYGGCRPICNGQFGGCVHGTCVGFNKCLCDFGMELGEDELFHCHHDRSTFEWKPYFWLILIPLAVVLIGVCIVLRRWMKVRTYYVREQNKKFSEECYSLS